MAAWACQVRFYRLSRLTIAQETAEGVEQAHITQYDAGGSRCRRDSASVIRRQHRANVRCEATDRRRDSRLEGAGRFAEARRRRERRV